MFTKMCIWAVLDPFDNVEMVVARFPWGGAPVGAVALDPNATRIVGRGWHYDRTNHQFTRFDGENGLGETITVPAGARD